MNWLMNLKNQALITWLVLLVSTSVIAARETLWVMDITNHGSSFSKYASNKEYDVTGNSYSKSGELSAKGMQEMYKLGQDFRKEYIDKHKFMPSSYDSNSLYLQSIEDQSSLMSTYAFMLGAYGDSVSFLNLRMDNAIEHQKLVRKTLGLSETPSSQGTTAISVTSEDGFLYWKNTAKTCPAIYAKSESHLNAASDALDQQYKQKLYPELAKTFKRSPDSFSFGTTHFYLDDYLTAKKQQASYPKFQDQQGIDKLIDSYERDFYYDGVLGGNEISRVIATPLLNFLLLNSFAQGESARGTLKDRKIGLQKHAHFFADEVPFAAFLKAIGYPQAEAPKSGQNIRFELFKTNNKYYVRATVDGKPLNFAEAELGIFELDTFLKTIYPMMYFGTIDDVCSGKEEIALNVYPKCQNYQEYLMMHLAQISKVNHRVVTKCHLTQKAQPVPVRRPERTVEHKVDLINVGFVEIVQIPQQKCRIDTRVIERTVPVIEEKVVVHEVEKLIAEKPTHIHHIVIETPDTPSVIPPAFIEKEKAAGWPWWLWLLPLLCYIPCLALLCCRKKKPAPIVRPKNPIAPLAPRPLVKPKEREIMHIKTEERHSPERKFVIEKKVVDEGEDIEMEITKELQKSRVIRESHQARAVSHGRHTAAELAADSAMNRGSGGGRRRRIKTIKKFGQVIGREEQILDEDGNVIKVERIGMDENEAASDHHLRSGPDVNYVRSVSGEDQYMRGADGAEHHFKETYERESHIAGGSSSHRSGGYRSGGGGFPDEEGIGAGGSGRYRAGSRRGFSSGRHIEATNAGVGLDYDMEANEGRYSPRSGGGLNAGANVGGSRVGGARVGGAAGGGFRQNRGQFNDFDDDSEDL